MTAIGSGGFQKLETLVKNTEINNLGIINSCECQVFLNVWAQSRQTTMWFLFLTELNSTLSCTEYISDWSN